MHRILTITIIDNVEKILKEFKENPYKVRMGAKKLAKWYKVSIEDVREARRFLRNKVKPQAKVLILDIETSPMKAWVWRRWRENIYIDQTIQEWYMLSWSGKKQFGFSSNSLDAIATFFGFDNKDPHDFILWKECLEGDAASLERLLKYNKKDVEMLEQVYLKMRPWIKKFAYINYFY